MYAFNDSDYTPAAGRSELEVQGGWQGGPPGGVLPGSDAFNPMRLVSYVVRYRLLLGAALLAGALLGLLVTLMQTPRFAAEARIEILVPTSPVFEDLGLAVANTDLRAFETEREKLKSDDLAQRVAHKLDLMDNAAFLLPPPEFALANVFNRAAGSDGLTLDRLTPERREAMAVSRVLSNLNVSLIRGTSLLSVIYTNTDPLLAQQVTNEVVKSYVDQKIDRTIATTTVARQFVQKQVGEVKVRLEESESALLAYAQKEGLNTTGDDASLIAANIKSVNASLIEATQKAQLEGRLVAIIDQGDGMELPEVLVNDNMISLRSRIAELRGTYQEKLSVFRPDYPDMLKLQSQIDEYDREVSKLAGAIFGSIRLRYQDAQRAEQDLSERLAELERAQGLYQDRSIQYNILRREVESNRSQYQSLIDKLNGLVVVADLRRTNVEIVDLATLPDQKVSPSLPRNLALFAAISLGLGLLSIYLLELINSRFYNPEQVERELGLPVLGVIPKVETVPVLAAFADPHSHLSESYRSLRTALQFSGRETPYQVILISSAQPGEAKSTTAAKLGREFAALGQTVLIIDADLRRPTLHKAFGMPNEVGLTDLLLGKLSPEDASRAFVATDQTALTLLPSGSRADNPADLLSSSQMRELIETARTCFDHVILDSPPVMAIADTLVLARLCDATLFIVSANQVTRKAAGTAVKRLHMAGARLAGTILVKFNPNVGEGSYAYKYQYYGKSGGLEDGQQPVPAKPLARASQAASGLFDWVSGGIAARSKPVARRRGAKPRAGRKPAQHQGPGSGDPPAA